MIVDSSVMADSEFAPSPVSYANHSTTWIPSHGMAPISTNPSRKRSRDETAVEAAEAENLYPNFPSAADVNPPEVIPEEPIYGEGMVLLNPQNGRALAVESQTGTWFEEKVDEEALLKAREDSPTDTRPKLSAGRKSVRLSQSTIRATLDIPNGFSSNHNSAPASPPKSTPTAEIDEATIALGIGWTKISSEDPDMQAAARGWARYLEVHYTSNIHGAEILLKNRSLDTYLVGCKEGFYLFTEDLLRGQLVGRTWETCLSNLRMSPIQFEGSEILQAERTPGPEVETPSHKETINDWDDRDRINRIRSKSITKIGPSQTGISGMDLD